MATAYPTYAEFQDYCLIYGYGTPSDEEATRIMASAVIEWDGLVGVRAFLSPGDALVTYHPQQILSDPRGWILDLIEPLADVPTSIYSGASTTQGGDLFTINEEYRLDGYAPYTQIVFNQKPLDLLRITGPWGYCESFGADVTDAVLSLAAARFIQQQQGKGGNTIEERVGLVAVRFDLSAVATLRAYAESVASTYRLP